MSDSIHSSWQHVSLADVRTAAVRAGGSGKGDRKVMVRALEAALPAHGYTALVGLSWREPGSGDLPKRVAEIGDAVPEAMLAYSGGWLYADGKIEPKRKGK